MGSITTLHRIGHAARGVSLIALVAFAAACADEPTTPRMPTTPETPATIIYDDDPYDPTEGAPVTARVEQYYSWATVGGFTIRFTSDNGFNADIKDNTLADLDARWGYVRTNVPKAKVVRVVIAAGPPQYGWSKTPLEKTWGQYGVEFHRVQVHPLSALRALFYSMKADGTAGSLISGGAVQITWYDLAGNKYTATLTENPATPGVTSVIYLDDGWYTVCETKAPTGYQWASPKCQELSVHSGISTIKYDLSFLHAKL